MPARPAAPPARQPDPAPAIDRHDPLLRFQLLTVSTYNGVRKAYIKDLLEGDARLVKAGEAIGGCKVVEISIKDQSARLKPPTGPEFAVYRDKPAKAIAPAVAPDRPGT